MQIWSLKHVLYIAGIVTVATAGIAILASAPHDATARQQSEADWKPVERPQRLPAAHPRRRDRPHTLADRATTIA